MLLSRRRSSVVEASRQTLFTPNRLLKPKAYDDDDDYDDNERTRRSSSSVNDLTSRRDDTTMMSTSPKLPPAVIIPHANVVKVHGGKDLKLEATGQQIVDESEESTASSSTESFQILLLPPPPPPSLPRAASSSSISAKNEPTSQSFRSLQVDDLPKVITPIIIKSSPSPPPQPMPDTSRSSKSSPSPPLPQQQQQQPMSTKLGESKPDQVSKSYRSQASINKRPVARRRSSNQVIIQIDRFSRPIAIPISTSLKINKPSETKTTKNNNKNNANKNNSS